jgi:hypothetical protein
MRPHEALALIICAALAAACSSQSRSTKPVAVAEVPAAAGTSTSATAATATAATATAGTATAAAATGAAAATNPAAGDVDPALVKEGYRVVRRQGKILYCQTQTVTGTKFGNTVCRTAEQIQEEKRETELSQRQLIRSGPAYCVGTQCAK